MLISPSFSIGSLFGGLSQPSPMTTFSQPISYSEPKTVSQPIPQTQSGGNMGWNWGGTGTGAASGAATGATVGGPWGAAIGGVLGAVTGGLSKPSDKSTSGSGGLTDAFGAGLGSLFGGGGSGSSGGIPLISGLMGGSPSAPSTVIQSQNVNQDNTIAINNILGREFAGGVSSDGQFDVMTAIGDVFKIRDVMNAQNAAPVVTGGAPMSFQQASTNWTPIVLIGGAVLALVLIMKGK